MPVPELRELLTVADDLDRSDRLRVVHPASDLRWQDALLRLVREAAYRRRALRVFVQARGQRFLQVPPRPAGGLLSRHPAIDIGIGLNRNFCLRVVFRSQRRQPLPLHSHAALVPVLLRPVAALVLVELGLAEVPAGQPRPVECL